jgi:hypothetical protein
MEGFWPWASVGRSVGCDEEMVLDQEELDERSATMSGWREEEADGSSVGRAKGVNANVYHGQSCSALETG